MTFLELELGTIVGHLVSLALAFVFALPVAWDRERSSRGMGLRTYPLVAMGSAALVLMAQVVLEGHPETQARILQGLITGIGFLGGGAIVKNGTEVKGLATAATLWSTALVGAAVAYSRYEIALALSVANFCVIRFLRPLKDELNEADGTEEEERAS
ncbi:MAG: MgtC/SapB family protein [Acidobacteriota bacterium]|nr:MgtC/SapB family protein [Acidobacteriota bacterium]